MDKDDWLLGIVIVLVYTLPWLFLEIIFNITGMK